MNNKNIVLKYIIYKIIMMCASDGDFPSEIFVRCVDYNYCISNNKKGIQCKNKPLKDSHYCVIHSPYKFPKPSECPICMDSIHMERKPLSCGHWVHKECILKWKDECPVCRSRLHFSKKDYSKFRRNSFDDFYLDSLGINAILEGTLFIDEGDIVEGVIISLEYDDLMRIIYNEF